MLEATVACVHNSLNGHVRVCVRCAKQYADGSSYKGDLSDGYKRHGRGVVTVSALWRSCVLLCASDVWLCDVWHAVC